MRRSAAGSVSGFVEAEQGCASLICCFGIEEQDARERLCPAAWILSFKG
jgi:hypothetical protein